MRSTNSGRVPNRDPRSNGIRESNAALDKIDRAILRVLAADARIANNALAERVGIAPSTCLVRVRALRERGVIRGFHADIDPNAAGRTIQAMIAVRMQADARSHLATFAASISAQPEVLKRVFPRRR